METTSKQDGNIMAASMATSAFSAIASGFEQAAALKAQGEYATSVANANAAISKLKAKQAIEAGDVMASRKNVQTRGAVGEIRAQGAGSGIDINSGSSKIRQIETTTAGAIDEATIRNNAMRAAWGYETQVIQDTFQGQFSSLTAKSQAVQSIATGGINAIAQPLGLYAQSVAWQRRYGMEKGEPGVPYNNMADDKAFWSAGYASPGATPGSKLNL